MNKKGLSLIAVIILIAFVVSLGLSVYLFSKRLTSERIEEVEQKESCLDVNIKILDACYTTSENAAIKIKIESKSSGKIDKGFLIKIVGDIDEVIPSLPFTILEGLNIEEISIPYEEEMGSLKEVQAIPKIRTEDGSQVICNLQSDKHA